METTVPILIGLTAAVVLCLGALLDDRRARIQRTRRAQPEAAIPLLHSINDDRCIGCEACIDVCPTEVLDLVEHKVRVSRFSDCVQCEQCANACPTQALVMYRQGTAPRMLTVPELDEQFQTGVPGQYLIGEVAGKPLVKNAANLGRAVIEHIARELAGRPAAGGDVLDVAIVGSGPGGLSAGLTCIKHALSCLVLEKEHVISSTVSRYPKGKHFMAEPCTSQNVSYLPVFDGSKEQLVAAWKQVVEGVGLAIKLGEAVETVQRGDDGVFTIKSTVGTYRARTVVLATGLRGKPRLLAVPGANLEKVQSLLDDAAGFAGEDVLVVGGGDSAVEGAMALAEVGANVTLSYRGDGFKRCKQGNQKRLAELIAGKRLAVLLESNVKCFTPGDVTIALADRSETTLANQRAFVLIGADTPVAWLETNHVRFIERPHLYALGSTEDAVRRFVPDAVPCPPTPDEALAILLDRSPPRSPGRRVQSVVEQLRDELREFAGEVITSVSAAFRLSDLAPSREPGRAGPEPPARGAAPRRASSKVIPASRLIPRRAATTGAVRRAPAPRFNTETTVEIASLPALEQRAIAALRHGAEPTTVEIASLPALEQRAIADLRRSAEELAAVRPPSAPPPAPAPAAPLRDEHEDKDEAKAEDKADATIEISSLRALEGPEAIAPAPADPTDLPIDLPTEIDMPSLRAMAPPAEPASPTAPGLATEIDLPSLRARKAARDAHPAVASPDPELRTRSGRVTGTARSAPPPVPSRPTGTPRPATQRPAAMPPPTPPRAAATPDSSPPRPAAMPPPAPPRAATTTGASPQRPGAMPPPVPRRAAATADPSTPRGSRLAHGSHSFATPGAPALVPAPPREGVAGDASGGDARATPVDHAVPGTGTRPAP